MKKMACVMMALFMFTGCAANDGFKKGLSDSASAKGSSRTLPTTADNALRSSKLTLVSKGFAIDSIDATSGIIKSSRKLPDEKNKDMSYRISATVDVTASGAESIVTLAANQQTVLHRTVRTWWKLLWILPLFPVETEYRSDVLKESDIVDPVFYNDFFNALSKNLTLADNAGANLPVQTGQPDQALPK